MSFKWIQCSGHSSHAPAAEPTTSSFDVWDAQQWTPQGSTLAVPERPDFEKEMEPSLGWILTSLEDKRLQKRAGLP